MRHAFSLSVIAIAALSGSEHLSAEAIAKAQTGANHSRPGQHASPKGTIPRSGGMCLDTPDQIAADARSIKIAADPRYENVVRAVEGLLRVDPLASDHEAAASLRADARAIAYMALQEVLASDPAAPKILWVGDGPHRWHGMEIPWSSCGFNNQDDIYRVVGIDPRSRYEITGRLPARPAPQVRFSLFRSHIDEQPDGLSLADIRFDPDGSFTIVIDNQPANGRPNHIQAAPETTLLLVRDVMEEWATRQPLPLTVKRIGAETPPMDDRAVLDKTASWAADLAQIWLKYVSSAMYRQPANFVPEPVARAGAWGRISTGHLSLAPDEALIVTLSTFNAAYTGFQLGDAFAIPLPFQNRSSSLSAGQVKANPDGSVTYVVSAKDPGIHNWIDTVGLTRPSFAIRWQGIPAQDRADPAVRKVELVKIDQVKSAIGANQPVVTKEGRRKILMERQAEWNRRIRCQ